MGNRIPGMKRNKKAPMFKWDRPGASKAYHLPEGVSVIAQGNRSTEDQMFQPTLKPKGMTHTMIGPDGVPVLLERKDEHGNTTYKRPDPDPALKGVKGKNCNRSHCQAPGAFWYHHDTRKWYCTRCARELNRANYHEAMEIYGHELCTIDPDFL